jgi:lysozyme
MTPLQELLIKHEGLRLKPYRCTAGKLTIGVGHNLDDKGITETMAVFILNEDIVEVTHQCFMQIDCYRDLDQVRQDALANLAFNLGINGLLKFKNTLKAIAEKRWEDAEKGLLNSLWAKQVQKDRVDDICHMIKTGEYR